MKKRMTSLLITCVLTLQLGAISPALAAGSTFTDVPADHWAYRDIEDMAARKVVSGLGDGRFNPDAKVTCAEFSVMTVQLFFTDELAKRGNRPQDYWWQPYADTLMELGAFDATDIRGSYQQNGDQWDKTVMEAPLNRYEMAGIMNNVMGLKDAVFPDPEEEAEAKKGIADFSAFPPLYRDAVVAMYTMGCLQGMDEAGNFQGESYMNRAQACAVLTRMVDKLENQPPDDAPDSKLQALREEMLALINQERAAEGRRPLVLDERMCQAAQVRAEELVRFYSHTRPDGRSCDTALAEVGMSYRVFGENIAAGQRSVTEVMDDWMNSAGHRANILEDGYGKVGIGCAYANDSYGVYWAQMFTN